MHLKSFLVAILICDSSAFISNKPFFGSIKRKLDSTDELPIPESIKAKISSPSYDILADPEAAEYLNSILPPELNNLRKSLADLMVTSKEIESGLNEVNTSDYEEFISTFKLSDYVTSPRSDWMRNGMPEDDNPPFSEEKLEEYRQKVLDEHPDAQL